MFKKSERLKVVEFATYFARGKRHYTPHLTIITAPAKIRKVAVVVGKKVSKKAVTRNQLRRRIYTQLRQIVPETYTGVYIVLVKPSFATLPRKAAQAFITETFASLCKNRKNT